LNSQRSRCQGNGASDGLVIHKHNLLFVKQQRFARQNAFTAVECTVFPKADASFSTLTSLSLVFIKTTDQFTLIAFSPYSPQKS
jgi:hypothetical protein